MPNPEHRNFGNEGYQEPESEVNEPRGDEPSSTDYETGYFDYGQIWHGDAPAPLPKEVTRNVSEGNNFPFKPDGSPDFDQMAWDSWVRDNPSIGASGEPRPKPEQTAEDTSETQPPDA